MSTRNEGPALVLDWGIGGLSVYRELKRLRPEIGVVYVSDSGFTPYGKVPAPELSVRVAAVIQRARREHGVASATIACNAASTVLETVRARCPELPVHGVIAAGIELVRESGCRRVGVIGGVRTIESRIFSSALPGIEVIERVAQPLSALIEAGVLAGTVLDRELEEILAPLANVEALLLACTHYPAVAASIQRILPKAKLLDPAARAAALVPPSLEGPDIFFTSGSREASRASALAAFGVRAEFGAWDG
jgi:glutamate racemase